MRAAEAQLHGGACTDATLARLRELCTLVAYAPRAPELLAQHGGNEFNRSRTLQDGYVLLAGGLRALEVLAAGSGLPVQLAAAGYARLSVEAHLAFGRAHPDLLALQRYVGHIACGGDSALGCTDHRSHMRYRRNLVPALATFATRGYAGLAVYAKQLKLMSTTPIDDAIAALAERPSGPSRAREEAVAGPSHAVVEDALEPPVAPGAPPRAASPPEPRPPRTAAPARVQASPARPPALPLGAVDGSAPGADASERIVGTFEGISVGAGLAMWRLLFAGAALGAEAAAPHEIVLEGVDVVAVAADLVTLVHALGCPQRLPLGALDRPFVGRIDGVDVHTTLGAACALLRPPEGLEPVEARLQGIALRAAPAMLRALIVRPAAADAIGPAGAFSGEVAGRPLAGTLGQMRTVVWPARAHGQDLAPVRLQLGGDDLVAPAAVVHLVLVRASAQSAAARP